MFSWEKFQEQIGSRPVLASCFSLVPFVFPGPFSHVALEVICPLWAWTGLQGWGVEHCPWCGRQWWPLCAWDTGPEGGCVSAEQGITSPEQSLTSLLSYTCTQNTLSQQSFQSLTCGSLWIQIFPDFSSILCRCKGWCGWMSLLAQCSVWLLL